MIDKKTILITGGTGLIGSALTKQATNLGYRVIILTQQKNKTSDNPLVSYAYWNVKEELIDENALLQADAIFHLAGASVADRRWTKKYKEEILQSRVNGGRLLVNKLKSIPHHVHTFISSSAIGWYGPDRENGTPFKETDWHHNDFLGTTCQKWEESLLPLKQTPVRLCILRTGIVLTPNGGALREFIKPVRMGVIPVLGNGNQVISWIHIDDLCRMFIYLLENPTLDGIFNAVASETVTNKKMIRTLAEVMHPFLRVPVQVPGLFLKMLLGESSIEVLKSTTVSNQKILNTGFQFNYPHLKEALNHLIKK